MGARSSSSRPDATTLPVAERDTGMLVCGNKISNQSPLASLDRLLLVVALALYLGAVLLQIADHLFVQPWLAVIARAVLT